MLRWNMRTVELTLTQKSAEPLTPPRRTRETRTLFSMTSAQDVTEQRAAVQFLRASRTYR